MVSSEKFIFINVHSKIKLYCFISALYFIPRFIFLCVNFPVSDLLSFYWDLSDSLLHDGILGAKGIKTTWFEPLYPLFLAAARWITSDQKFLVLLFQIVIGTIGCLYLYELGYLLSRNKRVGLITSLLYSFYPYLVYQASMVIEITLLTTLLILSTYYYCKASDLKNSICCGIFFGFTILTRTTALPILLLGVGTLLLRKSYRKALLVLGVASLMCSPMIIRNYRIDGSLLPTRSGESLFDGNLEYSDKIIPQYSVDILYPYVYGLLNQERPELAWGSRRDQDRFFTQKALQFMTQHPWRTLELKVRNIFYLFYPRIIPFYPMNQNMRFSWDETGNYNVTNAVPRSLVKELAYSIPYTFILVTAAAGLYLRRREFQRDIVLYLIAFSFTLVYSLYYPTTHQRMPMEFVLMFYSAYATDLILKRFKILAWQIIENPA